MAALTCAVYRAHQSSHRRTPDGWICDVCQEEPMTAAPIATAPAKPAITLR